MDLGCHGDFFCGGYNNFNYMDEGCFSKAAVCDKMSLLQSHYRTCNLCEAMCGLVITTTNGNIDKIEGDKKDPLSHGYICPNALA